MKIAVWKTGHEIADTVAEAVYEGLQSNRENNVDCFICESPYWRDQITRYDIHIAYGILRGTTEVFREAGKAGKSWFNIDKGYWKPGHYDGYYRVSLRGTQQTFGFDKLVPDYERWDSLGIEVLPDKKVPKDHFIACPPTDYVCKFFGCDNWFSEKFPFYHSRQPPFVYKRAKGSSIPLQEVFDKSLGTVATFNSSVGWEALRQGIPVVSDPTHSIVGAYQKLIDKPLHTDTHLTRALFSVMAGLQLTLDEMRQGKLWPLMQTLLSCTSASTAEKQ